TCALPISAGCGSGSGRAPPRADRCRTHRKKPLRPGLVRGLVDQAGALRRAAGPADRASAVRARRPPLAPGQLFFRTVGTRIVVRGRLSRGRAERVTKRMRGDMTSTRAPELSTALDTNTDVLTEMYRRMRLIRQFEDRAARLYRNNEIPGFLHLSIGQEASAVGACWPLGDRDVVTSTHRGHGHCIAKGMDVEGMFAELMGKETGTCRGRGGSMHIADPRHGVFGANGIVAAGLPIAAGAATAAQLRGEGAVVLAFFGDGAVAQGMFHEAVNLASVWNLPVIFFCENNKFAEFSPIATQTRASLADRAPGYAVDFHHVDGNDVVAVASLVNDVANKLRAGAGPVLIEADTYRWHGHYEGDP